MFAMGLFYLSFCCRCYWGSTERSYVYFPTSELCCEAYVLSTLSDGERLLILGDFYCRCLCRFVELHARDARRREGILDEFLRVSRPFDDVYFFSAEL